MGANQQQTLPASPTYQETSYSLVPIISTISINVTVLDFEIVRNIYLKTNNFNIQCNRKMKL